MTQYKNPFEDPEEKLWDQKIKDFKIPKRKKTPIEEKAEAPDLEGYIYVPSIKLYVAKEKSLHGLSWYKTHEELHKQGLQMLTIRQFIDFALYLERNPSIPGVIKIMNEILAASTRDPWRGEWLDAYFSSKELRGGLPIKEETDDFEIGDDKPSKDAGKLYIHYNHRTVDGKVVAQNVEPLEKCLMEECRIDLKSCNKQGMPTKEGNNIGYYHPRECRVAGFGAVSCNAASISCQWDVWPYPSIGVRPALKLK